MRLATGGDVVLAGFRLTREEWDDLDAESQALLLASDEDDVLQAPGAPVQLELPAIGHRYQGNGDVRRMADDRDEQPQVGIEVRVEQLEPDEAAADHVVVA